MSLQPNREGRYRQRGRTCIVHIHTPSNLLLLCVRLILLNEGTRSHRAAEGLSLAAVIDRHCAILIPNNACKIFAGSRYMKTHVEDQVSDVDLLKLEFSKSILEYGCGKRRSAPCPPCPPDIIDHAVLQRSSSRWVCDSCSRKSCEGWVVVDGRVATSVSSI